MTNANKTARNAAQAIAKNLRSQLEDSGIEFTTINLAKATVTELETFTEYAEGLLNAQSLMSNPQEEIDVFNNVERVHEWQSDDSYSEDTLESINDDEIASEAPTTFEFHGLTYKISGADQPGYSFTVHGYEWELGEEIGLFSFQDARRSAEVVIDGLIQTYFTPTDETPTQTQCCVSAAIVLVSVIVAIIVITTTSLRIGARIIGQVRRSQTIREILRQVLPLDRPYKFIEV